MVVVSFKRFLIVNFVRDFRIGKGIVVYDIWMRNCGVMIGINVGMCCLCLNYYFIIIMWD